MNFIVLLRGINVGGHRKIKMEDLRDLLTTSGFEDVKTYIQSGNVILNTSEISPSNIQSKIKTLLLHHFNFEVPVIAKTRFEFQAIFDKCPFSEEKKENSYFVLLSEIPNKAAVKEVSKIKYENEEFQIINDCVYFYSHLGYGNSKFNMNMIEKKLNVNATSRNFKTMVKLLSLCESND